MPVMIACTAGRRGVNDAECRTCGTTIHQHPGEEGTSTWRDGGGHENAWESQTSETHNHAPATEIGPTLGPFDYAELTYDTLRVDDGATLAVWDVARGDWLLTELAGDAAGEAYSDLTIHAQKEG